MLYSQRSENRVIFGGWESIWQPPFGVQMLSLMFWISDVKPQETLPKPLIRAAGCFYILVVRQIRRWRLCAINASLSYCSLTPIWETHILGHLGHGKSEVSNGAASAALSRWQRRSTEDLQAVFVSARHLTFGSLKRGLVGDGPGKVPRAEAGFIHVDDVSCPAQRTVAFRTIASMLVVLALSRTSRFDTLYCQRIFSTERRLHMWNASNCLMWRLYSVHDSHP